MKKYICTVIIVEICISMLLLISCADKGSSSSMNEILTLDRILTKKYNLIELRNYFEGKNANEPAYCNGTSQNLQFNDVNRYFPVEAIRPGGYSVYAVNQGGYYYVFWSTPNITNNNFAHDAFVYFSAYIPSSMDLNDFSSLKLGISTAKDVMAIDSSFELSFLMSSGIFSYSFLNDQSVLEIEYYEVQDKIDGYDDLVVKEITVIPRSTAPSRYSSILSMDLPTKK